MTKLKELRQEKGLTQKELADNIGVHYRTLQNWEKGESQIKPDKAQTLADYFGVSVGYLLGYSQFRDSQEASEHLNKTNPKGWDNHVKARISAILGDDMLKELEKNYVVGSYDDPDYTTLISFLSAVNQLAYTDDETLLLNYGILSKEDKKIVLNLVAGMAEKVKEAAKKEPWQNGF